MTRRQFAESSRSHRSGPFADLRFGVSDLAHRPGVMRSVEKAVVVPGLGAGGVGLAEPESIELDLRLEGVGKGIVVEGFLRGQWVAECSRCLEPVTGPFVVEVHELFEEQPVESETYLLEGEEIDIEPMVRDAVLLELPTAPLCTDDCLGLCPVCGADRNTQACQCIQPTSDDRWAALRALSFDETSEHR